MVLVGTLAVAACGGGDDDDSAAGVAEPAADFDADFEADFEASGDSGSDDGFIATDDRRSADFDIGVVGRDVIIEMRVVLSSDDIERTVSAIMTDAAALGGGVASSDVNYGSGNAGNDTGDENDGWATLTVKVPPQSLDRLLAGLDDTATVQSINQSAQDVTEQLVDLDVRISNARQSVANVRDFMDRAEDLNDLVSLEGELTRRQTELERLEAQQRNLSDRVALSTVTIEIVPTAAVPTLEPDEGIGDAFSKGWDAFVAFFFGLAFVLAVLLPFLALVALLLGVAWLVITRIDGQPGTHATDMNDHEHAHDAAAPEPAVQEPAAREADDLVATSHDD